MNMRGTETHRHRAEGGNWSQSVNLKLISPHTTLLCIVLPHIILYLHYKKYNYQPLVPSEERKTATQMKDSTRTVLDNLSDHGGQAKWQDDWFFFFFFFSFLATWKDILHLAHISWILCILKQNLRAWQMLWKRKETAMKRCSHTPTACVPEIYCTWVLQLCESNLWWNEQ